MKKWQILEVTQEEVSKTGPERLVPGSEKCSKAQNVADDAGASLKGFH